MDDSYAARLEPADVTIGNQRAPQTDDSASAASGWQQAARMTRLQTVLASLALLAAAGILLAHAGLILGGSWSGDEFSNFTLFRDQGLQWYFIRIFEWSPRPLSDGVLYLYSLAVNHWHMALITPFLGTLWAVLIGSTVIAAWQRGASGLLTRMSLAVGILALVLVGHNVFGMFYWPMGAAAYMLDLTGITVVTFQVLAGGTSRRAGRLACAVALIAAATSSEAGLFFTLVFTFALLVLDALIWTRGGDSDQRTYSWYVVPLLAAWATAGRLVYLIASNPSRGLNQGSIYFHNLAISLAATLHTSAIEAFWGENVPAGMSTPVWRAMLGLFFLGCVWACGQKWCARAAPERVLALFAGLAGCYYITLFASYFEYGEAHHQPQQALRKCLIPVAVLVVAWFFSRYLPGLRRWLRIAGPAALLAAICLAALSRIPSVGADYLLLPEIRDARAMTWQSGLGPGTTLRFYVPPRGHLLLGGFFLLPGRFVFDAPGVQFWQNGVMGFFHKRQLELLSLPPSLRR